MQNRETGAKKYPEQLRALKQKIANIERELAFRQERKGNLSGCGFEQRYVATTPTEAAFAVCIQKIDELERLLEYRYIDCLSWQEIQQVLFVSPATVFRIHSNALSTFQQFFVKK